MDLNNGLDDSHQLNFLEEVLCLNAIFSYSGFIIVITLAINVLFKREEHARYQEETMTSFMRTAFLVLIVYFPLSTIIRTESLALPIQNLILTPIVCLSFTLMSLRRVVLMQLRKHRNLSGYTLNLGQLWFEFITFPLIYLYLGRPDLELIVKLSTKHTPFDLIPDIFASFVYGLYIVLTTQSTK